VVALRSFDVPRRQPAWLSEPEIVREERERESDDWKEAAEDFDHDHYAYGSGD
jgi:hypothetical protein